MLKIHGFLHVLVLSTCGENSKLLRVKKNRTSQTFPYIIPKRKRIEKFKEKVCEAVTSNTPEKKKIVNIRKVICKKVKTRAITCK